MAPTFTIGANTAGRVPTTTSNRPSEISSHVRYRARLSPPTNIATRSPNASTIPAAVAGTGTASGTNTIARRPPARHVRTASTTTATSSSGAGRTHERPRPAVERSREQIAVPIRREEVRQRGLDADGGGGPAERGMGWLGKRSGAAAAPPRASPP